MNNKERKAFLIKNTKTAVAISSFLFLLSFLINDLNAEGAWSSSGYYVTKQALGALGIGLGFGLASVIFTNPKLSQSVQTAVYIVIGCIIMVGIGLLVGMIPTDKGLLRSALAVLLMLVTAFIIWGLTYSRQKKLAQRINLELEKREN